MIRQRFNLKRDKLAAVVLNMAAKHLHKLIHTPSRIWSAYPTLRALNESKAVVLVVEEFSKNVNFFDTSSDIDGKFAPWLCYNPERSKKLKDLDGSDLVQASVLFDQSLKMSIQDLVLKVGLDCEDVGAAISKSKVFRKLFGARDVHECDLLKGVPCSLLIEIAKRL